MELKKEHLAVFKRATFSFKQLKESHSAVEIEQIKAGFKTNWQEWKTLNQRVAASLPSDLAMTQPKVESWTNGWNIRSHFWCAYRSETKKRENACLATLLNQKQYQIYLMFQHYKSDERTGTIEQYNQLLEELVTWSQDKDLSHYYIWPQVEHELVDHWLLSDYLKNEDNQQVLIQQLAGRTFQIGKLYFAQDLPLNNCEQVTVDTMKDLASLYQKLVAFN
ncbi:MAG: HI_0552 family protein [Enterococcus sp.]